MFCHCTFICATLLCIQCMLARFQTCLTLFSQGRHYNCTIFVQNSQSSRPSWCQMRPHPSPLMFKKAVDHTCSRSILGCGNHDGGNGTECAICLGAVTLRFYGNTPPGVTVTLLSFLSLPAILRSSLGPVKKRADRSGVTKASQEKRAGSKHLVLLRVYLLIMFPFSPRTGDY